MKIFDKALVLSMAVALAAASPAFAQSVDADPLSGVDMIHIDVVQDGGDIAGSVDLSFGDTDDGDVTVVIPQVDDVDTEGDSDGSDESDDPSIDDNDGVDDDGIDDGIDDDGIDDGIDDDGIDDIDDDATDDIDDGIDDDSIDPLDSGTDPVVDSTL